MMEDGDSFGHRSFRVAKKPFAILGEHDGVPSLAIKTDHVTQARLVQDGGYYRTPYVGQHGWVSVAEDTQPDWGQIAELITDAYRRVAPKRLQKLLGPE
jgi:predicted DNA-binding protein (MmcQ/YjbR family)